MGWWRRGWQGGEWGGTRCGRGGRFPVGGGVPRSAAAAVVLGGALALAAGGGCDGGGDDDVVDDDDDDSAGSLTQVDLAGCLTDPDCPYVFGCGHRGTAMFAPENTLVGYQMALDLGMDAVEIDVRPTADEVLVLMHDSSVDRTTDGTGEVDEMTLEEIRDLVVVSEFEGIDDQPVPTFAEFLDEFGGRALVNIDAKTTRFDLIAADLAAAGAREWVYVQVDSVDEAQQMRAVDPTVPIMPDADVLEDLDLYVSFDPELIELPWQNDDPELVSASLALGIKPTQDSLGAIDAAALVHEANGDDPCQAFQPILDMGIGSIQTDVPHLLAPCLEAFNADLGYVAP